LQVVQKQAQPCQDPNMLYIKSSNLSNRSIEKKNKDNKQVRQLSMLKMGNTFISDH